MNAERLRILVVEDDVVDQLAVRRVVRDAPLPYDLVVVSSVAEAANALASAQLDAIVTDFALGDGSALDVLSAAGDLPVIVVTGAGDQEKATSALKAGASDYLVKDARHGHLSALGGAIDRAIRMKAQDRRVKMLVHVLTHIGEAVSVCAPDGRMVFVNRAFCEMYGWTEREVLGKSLASVWPAGACSVYADGDDARSQGTVLATKDGRHLATGLTQSAVHDDAGKLIATVRIMRDVSERNRIERELRLANGALERSRAAFEELAIRDELTGLYNRRELSRRLEMETSRALRTLRPFSFLLLDVDHFKSVNDRYGHSAGDEVLRRVSLLIEGELRITDTAARYGGEEIAVILPDTSAEHATAVAQRLRERLEAEPIAIGSGAPITVTASFGVATLACDAASPQAVFAAADEALYEAKATGRNRVVTRVAMRKAA
ncbi:MAG: diguanylate cyclase [Labilithrix sp.]|nr:diguanylate cyclase [Labilithrix sp.]